MAMAAVLEVSLAQRQVGAKKTSQWLLKAAVTCPAVIGSLAIGHLARGAADHASGRSIAGPHGSQIAPNPLRRPR